MIYPIGCKRNNRYRGPVESIKLNMNNLELKKNIDTLYTTLNQCAQDAVNINLSISSSDRSDIENRKIKINDQITNIMEAIRFGY